MKFPLFFFFFFFVFPFLFIFPFTNSGDTDVHNRRTLHQPFTPNLTTTGSPPAEQPFYPKFPSPPPPPSASFPANNTPSINLPNSPKSKPVSSKLVATAVTLVIAAAIVVAIVVYLRIQKRRRYDHDSRSFNTDDNMINRIPKLSRPLQSRSAFASVPVDNYKSEAIIGLNSSSCSSSSFGSGYQASSVSVSISPPVSLSSITSSPKSSEIQTAPPPLPLSVIPAPDITPSDQNSPPPTTIPPPPTLIELLPENEENVKTPKTKLKPLHWDKVRASSDRETVWDQIKSSSFRLNEEMMETLFIKKTPNSSIANRRIPPWPPATHENRVLDLKKSQNIAILHRALHVTIEEVCDALLEGNADTLGTELLESLLKMAPTKEEEWKLKQCEDDDLVKLGPAEKFLKVVLDVPFAFKRVGAMLYVSNFESEVEYIKRSFQTLEVACEELRNNRMFLKLLEAVLKTGNRMNVGTTRGDAHAFKLDTLLKLIDVKATDGKTTLLHFVVQEIIKSEGAHLSTPNTNDTKCRKFGLQLVANISSQLSNVKKAAAIDSEVLNNDVIKLSQGISDISQVATK